MRVHLSQQVLKLWYQLGEKGVELRQALESLKTTPVPEWARKVEGYDARYEFLVSGYSIVYEIDKSGGETVIIVSAIEETI